MVRVYKLLAGFAGIAFAAVEASDNVVAFVATGTCDTSDPKCVEGPAEPETKIRPLIIDKKTGSMVVPPDEKLAIATGGAPIWLTTTGNGLDDGCIFAALGNKSEIFSYSHHGSHIIPSGGVAPVFASVTNKGRTLLVANYHGPDNANTSVGACVASFAIASDCSLTFVDRKNHSGHSSNPQRQGGAHVHSVVPVRGGLAYACDLGMDKIFSYAVADDGKLTELHRTDVEAGSGPRHLVQHPSLPYIYVVNEMAQCVRSYKQQAKGVLELVQTQSVVHSKLGNATASKAAEIAISPDGKFVFATNRGHQNTVTVFKTLSDGTLSQTSYVEAPAYPRGMALIADGSMLVVAGQSQTEVWSYFVGQDGDLRLASRLESSREHTALPPHPATFTTFEPYSPLNVVV